MSSPFIKPSFSGFPEESSIRNFRNTLLELKKTIQSSHNITELKMQMEHFINANRSVTWPHKSQAAFRKDEGEKAVAKVVTEFERYLKDLKHHQPKNSYQNLLDAILMVESMIDRLKEGH